VKKSIALLGLFIILLLGGAYLIYRTYYQKEEISVWDIIPKSAVLIYESDQCSSCGNTESSVNDIISQALHFKDPTDSISEILKELPTRRDVFVSVHPVKKDDFDFVYFSSTKTLPPLLLKKLNNPSHKKRSRSFNSGEIYEVSIGTRTFSYAIIENIWAGSFTPFLIEDVIRTYTAAEEGLNTEQPSMQKKPIQGDAGNLYIRLDLIENLFNVFSYSDVKSLENFGKSLVLDIKNEETNLILNGFSDDSDSDYTLSIFQNQDPVAFDLKRVIPTDMVLLQVFGISAGDKFRSDLFSFRQKKRPALSDSLRKIETYGVSLNQLYDNVHNEMALCLSEAKRKGKATKSLIVETRDPNVWLRTFDRLSDKLSKDTVFYEKYGNYEIKEVPIYRFPEKLFWPIVSGFDRSFYTSMGKNIIISDNLEELKEFLDNLEQDDVWSKSVAHNKFLETTLLESNVSLFFNTGRLWNLISLNAHNRWKEFIVKNRAALSSLKFGAVQFSHLNNSFYTNIILNENREPTTSIQQEIIVNFEVPITSLHGVKSHVNKTDELLIQDSLNSLSLLTNDGSILWKMHLDASITSEVHQIDFLANGKLQYFFTTKEAIHVIDRLGNYVSPFPIQLKDIQIKYATVIDYDRSKNYRFLVADEAGKIWIFDKTGKNLEGWQPKDISTPLLTAPRHHRIKGKDYIIAIGKNGTVHLMNRRGETINNFPLQLDTKLSGNYYLDTDTQGEPNFVVVSDDGHKIKFTHSGKILSRETLVRTSVGTQFSLHEERADKGYLVLQQDAQHFNLLDEDGTTLIQNEFIGNHKSKVDYYDFGAGQVYISLTDREQDLVYIYDETGTLITLPPIESQLLELRPTASGCKLFYIQGKSLHFETLKSQPARP
jgi:hypothetical protein